MWPKGEQRIRQSFDPTPSLPDGRVFVFLRPQVIVVSFVRSNAEGTVGHLLRDWRRLNVALSRAKRKLVLIGSLRTLSSCAILSSLAGILKTRRWVYPLPRGAHRVYPEGLGSLGGGGGRGAVLTGEMHARAKSGQDYINRDLNIGSQCDGREGGREIDDGDARGLARSVDGGGGPGLLFSPSAVGGGGEGGGGARAGSTRRPRRAD